MRRSLVLFVCTALAASSAPSQAAIVVGPPESARLSAGEVLLEVHIDEKEAAASVSAVIDIAATPDAVWAVMTDCALAPRFVPDLISCRVLQSDPAGRWDIREHMIDWAWFLPTVRNVFRSDYERPRLLRFKRVEGDLEKSEGEWRLEPLNGGAATRLSYTALLSPRSWIPPSLALSSVEADVPKVLLALRRECTGK